MLGKPVIITDFKTAASQVHDGFDAIISPMNVKDFASDIIRLMNDDNLRNTLSANTMTSDYSNSGQMEKIYRLIENEEV